MRKKFVQVYLDFQIGTSAAGRVVFELFTDITPKTAENFRGLCTGEYGNVGMGKKTKRLTYLNTPIHRIVDNLCIQGGDIINGDGTGGASIYGGPFVDENFQRRHACAGLLSMANRGRNSNQSQFFITLKPSPHLDGKHVVFGQVIEGMEVIKKIGEVRVDMQDRPVLPITITNCGEIVDLKKHWKCDPFNKEIIDEYREEKWKTILELSSSSEDEEEEADPKVLRSLGQRVEKEPEHEESVRQPNLEKSQKDKLLELRQRMNHAKVLNDRAVLQEEKLNTDAKFNQKYKQSIYSTRREQEEKDLAFKNIDKEQAYLNKLTLSRFEFDNDLEERKGGKKDYFGWEVFNDDAVYNAYKKRCTALEKNKELYEQTKPGQDVDPTPEALERLATDVNKQIEKRKSFNRRRIYVEDEAVTYINERNRNFNRKLNRHFGHYAADIKANLERGTAH